MKTLYIIRHAKSSWGDFSVPDFERPLNERGKKDAPVMAQRLLDKGINIDIFISSPAKRAYSTCKYFCTTNNIPKEKILIVDELYHASADIFYKVVCNISDQYESAAIFSHNPGISAFANSLVSEVSIDHMPTCAVFGVSLNINHWKQFTLYSNKFLFFEYPKLL